MQFSYENKITAELATLLTQRAAKGKLNILNKEII